jgi:NAD+ synthase
MPVLNVQALIDNRVEAIRAYHKEAGLDRAELDVSGGIDSACMLMLLAEALGPDKVTAVYSSIHSSEASLNRARLVADAAGVKLVELDLSAIYDDIALEAMRAVGEAGYDTDEIVTRMGDEDAVAGSLRSCLRAPIGRYLNRMTGGGIRHGTGNEDEDRWLRFYQKGGDGEVDTNPLAMLSKGEVYQLSNALNVPREIIEALPTPDLWGVGEKHNDEEELTRLSGGVEWNYSRINPDTNEYVRVGTIERMSRLLDLKIGGGMKPPISFEEILFGGALPDETKAEQHASYGEPFGLTAEHLASARKWERITRHKMNPNCPTLGVRQELLNAGILTDELPKL